MDNKERQRGGGVGVGLRRISLNPVEVKRTSFSIKVRGFKGAVVSFIGVDIKINGYVPPRRDASDSHVISYRISSVDRFGIEDLPGLERKVTESLSPR